MKRILFVVIVLAVAAGLMAFATDASAHKYGKMQKTTMQTGGGSELASAEQNRSMTDCMEYTANFRSRGMKRDMATFNKQYGGPYSESGRVLTYHYDNYTNIILDCRRGCITKCLGR